MGIDDRTDEQVWMKQEFRFVRGELKQIRQQINDKAEFLEGKLDRLEAAVNSIEELRRTLPEDLPSRCGHCGSIHS